MIKDIFMFFLNLLSPKKLEALLFSWGWLGYPILFGIVFSETGLLLGFFFPGDSMLFIAGFVSSTEVLNILWLQPLLLVAAISGNATGYMLGKKTGPTIFSREDSRFFKKSHLLRTQEFYNKHGGKTIILAQFIPILRTFAPFIAGVAKMEYRRFAFFNVIGAIGWIYSMTSAGYFLGNVPFIKKNFEATILCIVFISLLPIFWQSWKSSRKSKPQ